MSETGKTANRREIIGLCLGPLDLGVGGLLPHHHIWSVIALMCIVVSGGAPAQPACGLGWPGRESPAQVIWIKPVYRRTEQQRYFSVQSYSNNHVSQHGSSMSVFSLYWQLSQGRMANFSA